MDFTLLVFLIVLNGLFAMSEMALTAARKARLQVMVESGEPGARAAMDLHENPTRFLSTVQIGITSIGVLNGIVGENAFSEPLSRWLVETFRVDQRPASVASTALVVVMITVLTIIFGELVPKRVGQLHPETVARLVARPMNWLSLAVRPLVMLLTACTNAILQLMGIRGGPSRAVTEEEIAASLEEGLDAGVIEAQEHQMVRNVFRLDDRQIGSMMIPRAEIVWLDASASTDTVLALIHGNGHTRYPVCRGGLDDVIGVLGAHSLLGPLSRGEALDLQTLLEPPVFVPETLSGMELLEHFRASRADIVFVVDEYGAVQGVISERDLLEAITGEFGTTADDDSWAVQRDDGSWLMDGLIPVPEFKDRLELKELPDEERGRYNTLAGMVMLLLGRLPKTTDTVDWQGWRFEVVDLDGKRVDKVLVTRIGALRRRHMINPLLHLQPVAVDRNEHRSLRLRVPVADWSVASKLNAIFVAAAEFGDVVREYPVVFVRAGDDEDGKTAIAPIAVFGLLQQQNLYVDGTGWRASYMPAVLRAYPFCVGRVDAERFAICIDSAWTGVSSADGEPLFSEAGEPMPLLADVQKQLETLEGEIQRTRLLCRRLRDLDLLQDMRFDATLPDGTQLAVDGFLSVDQQKLTTLADEHVIELHKSGLLGLIHAHHVSMGNMRRLLGWHIEQVARPLAASADEPVQG